MQIYADPDPRYCWKHRMIGLFRFVRLPLSVSDGEVCDALFSPKCGHARQYLSGYPQGKVVGALWGKLLNFIIFILCMYGNYIKPAHIVTDFVCDLSIEFEFDGLHQCCGYGSASGLNTYSMGSPDSRSGSGSRREKLHEIRTKLINFICWSAGCSLLRAEGFSSRRPRDK